MLIGEKLKNRRLDKKIKLYEVGKKLNISISNLEAIESDEIFDVAGKAYAIGFIRTYSDFLELNSNEIIEEFKVQISMSTKDNKIELPKPIELFQPFLSFKIVSIIIFATLSTSFYFLFINKNENLNYAITSQLPEEFEPMVEEYEVNNALKKINEQKIKTNNLIANNISTEDEESFINNNISAIASKPSKESIEDLDSLISIKVIKSTWIQIRDKDEKIIFSKLMDNDDEYSYPLNENYFITTGNAGNILISIGGKIFGKLGKKGEVIESLLISKEFFSN
tara:strand:- start:2407 stop:3249 length:843 start_codon:yes stop_codon:yes gene_type:complete